MAIIAIFNEGQQKAYTQSMYQHDKNQTLMLVGIELPKTFEVHFSNDPDNGIAYPVKGTNYQVRIPNALFSTGEYIYAFIESEDDQTIYSVVMPVIRRPVRIDVKDEDDGDEDGSGFQGFVMGEDETLIPVVKGSIVPVQTETQPTSAQPSSGISGFDMGENETLVIV